MYALAIVRSSINQIQVNLSFWLRSLLRSRSRVDLVEFFSKYDCIDPVDLYCLSVSTVMVYTSVRMASSSMTCVILPLTPQLAPWSGDR